MRELIVLARGGAGRYWVMSMTVRKGAERTPDKAHSFSNNKKTQNQSHPSLTSDRLLKNLREHDVKGEKAIAAAQAAISGFVLLLHLIAQFKHEWQGTNFLVISALGALLGTSSLRIALANSKTLPERLFDALNVIDIAIFLALIWSYQFAYEHPAGGTLKAPSFMLLFALVALRALRFHPRPILTAGFTAIIGWSTIVIMSLMRDGSLAITHSYTDYLSSYKILIGAEIEKVIALLGVTIFLALATNKARKLLSKAAHVDDYVEALADAECAKEKAETTLGKLDQRDLELTGQNRRFTAALENMSQGLCMFDNELKLVVCNGHYADMYGIPQKLAIPGISLREILEHRVENGLCGVESPEDYIEEVLKAASEDKPTTQIRELSDGRIIAISHRPMQDGGCVATHEDITEIQRFQEQIAHMSEHDALTDLPNRELIKKHIEKALLETDQDEGFAVLHLGLDRFKSINETLGHALGDELLKAVAVRLQECVCGASTIARLGGDEFVILQRSSNQPNDATHLVNRICDMLKEPFDLKKVQVVVDASIGIALAPADGNDADQLLKSADIALDRAKREGAGSYRFFEADMDALVKKRGEVERELRQALAQDEFELYYQPIVNLASNEIAGFEALLRWHNPRLGMVSPMDFIPLAEEIGLIIPIGEWVIKEACAQAAKWPKGLKMAVNLSPVQFRSQKLSSVVVGALADSGLAPNKLELEITETALLQNSDATMKLLRQLQELGVKIVMDDFGTGYSSLSYLRSFPFDKIKLDQSFVRDLGEKDDAIAIVRAVASLGSSLGVITTAEGVETQEQRDCVHHEGYTEMQGYLFGKPQPAKEVTELYFSDKDVASENAA